MVRFNTIIMYYTVNVTDLNIFVNNADNNNQNATHCSNCNDVVISNTSANITKPSLLIALLSKL